MARDVTRVKGMSNQQLMKIKNEALLEIDEEIKYVKESQDYLRYEAGQVKQRAENIKKMFDALITTLPGLTNVGMLLALMFFIYSVVGVQLFATVAYNGDFNASADFR